MNKNNIVFVSFCRCRIGCGTLVVFCFLMPIFLCQRNTSSVDGPFRHAVGVGSSVPASLAQGVGAGPGEGAAVLWHIYKPTETLLAIPIPAVLIAFTGAVMKCSLAILCHFCIHGGYFYYRLLPTFVPFLLLLYALFSLAIVSLPAPHAAIIGVVTVCY